LDRGSFCANLLTKGFDFVGIAGKLLLSKTGCKREMVNRIAIGYLLALKEPMTSALGPSPS
jgi:hypothetical protein